MKEIIIVIVAVIALIVGLPFIGFEIYQHFAPKYRAVDNAVFKESEQYNDGMVRDLENLQMEYLNSDDAKRIALRAIILHRFAVYPESKMPANLRNFYTQLRNGK